jgi:hypothetical protein
MQSNQNVLDTHFNIIDTVVWETLHNHFIKREQLAVVDSYIQDISINYNIDKKQIINDFYNYLILKHNEIIVPSIINNMETMIHNYDCDIDILVDYFILDNINSFS